MWIPYSTMEWKEALLIGPCIVPRAHTRRWVHGKIMGGGVILGCHMHIHVKDEVSMPTHMGRRVYKRKLPKWLPFKNYKSELLNI